MTYTLGVDVSHYQGTIDWAKVAATSYDFALARMIVGRNTLDLRGAANLRGMLGRVPVPGAYGVVGTSEPVTDGAKRLVDEMAATGADPASTLVMLDAEDFADGTHPTVRQVDAYARQLHALIGRWPVAYVPSWWMSKHGYSVAGLDLARCPWAPSHYLPAPWTEAKLEANRPTSLHGFGSLAWLQYTSSGTVQGIAGNVDLNCFYGSLADLRRQLLGARAPSVQEDLDMATADDILAYLRDLKQDLTVGGTTSLGGEATSTTEAYAKLQRDTKAAVDGLADAVAAFRDDVAARLDALEALIQPPQPSP
jgi:hypothetical protein